MDTCPHTQILLINNNILHCKLNRNFSDTMRHIRKRVHGSPSQATPPLPVETSATEDDEQPQSDQSQQTEQSFVEKFRTDLKEIADEPKSKSDIRRLWNLYQTLLFVFSNTMHLKKRKLIEDWKKVTSSTRNQLEDIGYDLSVCNYVDERTQRTTTYEPLEGYGLYTLHDIVDPTQWEVVTGTEKLLHIHYEYFDILFSPNGGKRQESLRNVQKAYTFLEDYAKKILQG